MTRPFLAAAAALLLLVVGLSTFDGPAGSSTSATCQAVSYKGPNVTIRCTVGRGLGQPKCAAESFTGASVRATCTFADSSTPTPTPTPPVSSPPPAGGFPDSTNTGVPAGVALTPYTGSCNIPAGTVIEAKTIDCASKDAFVKIMGAGVTITKSKILGVVRSEHSETPGSSVSISDTYIDGGNQETFPSVSYDSVALTRVEVVGGQHSVQCNSNCTVRDSYLHAQYLPSSSAGHVNAFISNGGHDFTLDHNTVWCSVTQTSHDGGCSGDVSFFGDFGPVTHVSVTNNLFHSTGGSFCLFAGNEPSKPYKATDVTITGNTFQRGSNGKCGYYGPITSTSSSYTISGNAFDNGAAVG